MENYYDILEVDASAGGDDIRRSFRRLSKRCHPDLHQGAPWAELQFKRLNEAYAVLSDPNLRRAYDRGLQAAGFEEPAAGQENAAPFTVPTDILRDTESPAWRYAFFTLFLLLIVVAAIALGKRQGRQPERSAPPPAAISSEHLTSEQQQFLELYKEYPLLLSPAEAGRLLQEELAPGYTDRLWTLLGSGDTSGFRLLIRYPEYYANERVIEEWMKEEELKN